ncbi:transposase, partial [Desulfofundulus thermobenzoicus]
GNFRDRLLESQQHKEALFTLVQMITDAGLIKKNENQRTDSFHIIANVAVPAASELIREGIRICLRQLKKRHYDLFHQAQEKLDITKYLKGELSKAIKPEPDETLRRQRLTEIVEDAKALIAFLDNRDLHPVVAYRRSILVRLLYENTEPAEKGYKETKETHPDRIISAVDPEARHGAKSKTKKFNGYKAHVTETVENKFITNIAVTPGNVSDCEPVVEKTQEVVTETGLKPEKMFGDKAYGTGENRQQLKEMGIQLVAPLHPQAISEDLARGNFTYDSEKQTVTCPAGITTDKRTYHENSQAWIYRFPKEACQACELRETCTKNKNGRT